MTKKQSHDSADNVGVGDCVLVIPADGGLDYVGKVVHKSSRGDKITLQWFYRPEDTSAGRQGWNGQDELYKSSHSDPVDIGTVRCKCRVMDLKDYLACDELKENDFFWRFIYVPAANGGHFENEPCAVYCVCGNPYNPDLTMVHCTTCRDWFHQSCMDLSEADVRDCEQYGYTCPKCKLQPNGAGAPAHQQQHAAGQDQTPATSK